MRPSHGTRTRTSCGRIFPDFVREWRRCSTDRDVGWNSDQGLRLGPGSEHKKEMHLAAAIGDLEAVDFGLVYSCGPPKPFRDEARLRDEPERPVASYPPVPTGVRNCEP